VPKMTRSVEEVDVVREQILTCAFEILIKHGYESLSMAKIGHKMKMTAANIYNYYGSKDELLIAIHKKAFAELYDKINYAAEKTETPLERCKAMAYAFVEFGISKVNIYDVMFNRPIRQYSDYIGTPQEALSSDEFHSSLKVLSYAIKIIREYRETRPDLGPVEPKLLAIQSITALHGIISLHNSGLLNQIADDPDTTFRTIIDKAISCVIG
jgi:AcrR family transcriptional regulator